MKAPELPKTRGALGRCFWEDCPREVHFDEAYCRKHEALLQLCVAAFWMLLLGGLLAAALKVARVIL